MDNHSSPPDDYERYANGQAIQNIVQKLVMLNRSAIIIRPKQPYIHWASQLDESGTLPDKNAEPSIYLIPDYHNDADAWALLEQRFESIFDAELEAWHRQPTDWPKDRSFSMFKRWFQINFVSLITDLCEGPIKIDDD